MRVQYGDCEHKLVPWERDHRMSFCTGGCNIFRCGCCGGTLGGRTWGKRRLPWLTCSWCGREYPPETRAVSYLLCQIAVPWWWLMGRTLRFRTLFKARWTLSGHLFYRNEHSSRLYGLFLLRKLNRAKFLRGGREVLLCLAVIALQSFLKFRGETAWEDFQSHQ